MKIADIRHTDNQTRDQAYAQYFTTRGESVAFQYDKLDINDYGKPEI